MENVTKKLMINLTRLTELEVAELKLKSAIFIRRITDKLETSIKEIELRVDEEIEFYGQNPNAYKEYKNKMLKKYNEEFDEITKEYELQYINLCIELQETQANQKIAIANCKKIKNLKDEFINSEKCQEYKNIKAKYKNDMDNSLTKEEFEKNMNLLKELKNPVDDYNNMINASLQKVNDYEDIIENCIQKMEQCIQKCVNELNSFVSQKTSQLQIYNKSNIFVKIFNSISNIFIGKKKLQTYVINNSDNELSNLEQRVQISKDTTRQETIKFIDKILVLRKQLNDKFEKNIKKQEA